MQYKLETCTHSEIFHVIKHAVIESEREVDDLIVDEADAFSISGDQLYLQKLKTSSVSKLKTFSASSDQLLHQKLKTFSGTQFSVSSDQLLYHKLRTFSVAGDQLFDKKLKMVNEQLEEAGI